ncbi:MAG: universal stress protein [Cyclobacteriaceae bacterium]|nr:universal stress protein [Cyclobacteriaceae bacterium HetDA_MAG_MS6]
MQKILVPTDFSTCAENACKIAMDLAKKHEAEIHFFHFTSVPVDWIGINDDRQMLYTDITRKVNGLQAELNACVKSAERSGVPATCYLGYNESYQHVLDYIDQNEIDLVIMGSHGATGLTEFLIGSIAQKIIRLSPVPVLVVKEDTHELSALKMIIVSDFPIPVETSFVTLLEFAVDLDLKVHLLFVNTPLNFTNTKEIKARMHEYQEIGHDIINSLNIQNADNLENGINDFLENDPNSIIAMATHGRTGLNRLVSGSVTESVMNHLKTPFLSVHLASYPSVL